MQKEETKNPHLAERKKLIMPGTVLLPSVDLPSVSERLEDYATLLRKQKRDQVFMEKRMKFTDVSTSSSEASSSSSLESLV